MSTQDHQPQEKVGKGEQVEAASFDLHGMPLATVTEGFDDEVGYLERVTVTDQAEAVRLFCEDWAVTADEIEVRKIHMRWTDEDPDPVIVPELPCWLECESTHPAAVPFWTVKP